MEKLHSIGYTHNDIKPDNIVLDSTGANNVLCSSEKCKRFRKHILCNVEDEKIPISIIDFGMVDVYKHLRSGNHIKNQIDVN